MKKDWLKRSKNLSNLYEDYNRIQDYLEKYGDWIQCPHCGGKVKTYMSLSQEDYKKIFAGCSRQMTWAKLDKMDKLGWIEKIMLKRAALRIKKYWHPTLKKRVANKIKKRR